MRGRCFVGFPVITCVLLLLSRCPAVGFVVLLVITTSRLSHCAECGFIAFPVKTRRQARFCPLMLCGYITKHDKTSHRPNKAQICPYKAF
jgi:hypothetical protein